MSNCNTQSKVQSLVRGKKVLFVATTYKDYLRIQQELRLIESHADTVDLIVSTNKKYWIRLLFVYTRLLFKSANKFDVVFLSFAPQLIQWCWWWKFKKQIVVIDFFISFYDTLVFDRKSFSQHSMIAKLLKKLDKFTIRHSDFIIADTHEHASYFVNELGADNAKVNVLYLLADAKFYYPRQANPYSVYDGKFVVFYFATVLPLQGVDLVVKAISQINNPDIHFIFVGPIEDDLRSQLFQQKNLTYFAWLEQAKLADLIAQADLCLAGHFNGEVAKAKRTIPGKAYIFEAMNKMMLLGENNANRERYPQNYNQCRMVEMGSHDSIRKAIINIHKEYTV